MDEQSQLRHALTDRDPGDESAIADHECQGGMVEATPGQPGDGPMPCPDCEAPSIRSLAPSGLELFYSWEPRRHYKIRDINIADTQRTPLTDWVEVPSVTTVLGVLDKSGAMTYWGNKVGAEGVLDLVLRGRLVIVND